MIAIIKYTNCGHDRSIIYKTLADMNAIILKSVEPDSLYRDQRIYLQIENRNEINKILSVLNEKTCYGVSLVKIKNSMIWQKFLNSIIMETK